jgi:hypothetical protein
MEDALPDRLAARGAVHLLHARQCDPLAERGQNDASLLELWFREFADTGAGAACPPPMS